MTDMECDMKVQSLRRNSSMQALDSGITLSIVSLVSLRLAGISVHYQLLCSALWHASD